MPTTSDYLTQLQQDREDLVDNLEAKGITGLSGDETFTELVPEVLNIPSGSNIIKLSQEKEQVTNFVNNFNNYALNIPNTYEVYTNEAATLYTPDINYKYYIIQKRASGKYRVDWFNTQIRMLNNINIYPFNSTHRYESITSNPIAFSEFCYPGIFFSSSPKDFVYVSPEYDTVELCIQKMQNNELTYTSMTNYLAYSADTPNIIPCSNIALYFSENDDLTNDGFIYPTFKISSNETFVQI